MDNDYMIKWNKYDVGRVPWINKHRQHPHRQHFLDFVRNRTHINYILEVGPGEMIEGQQLLEEYNETEFRYTVLDISSVFLQYALELSNNYVNLDVCEGSMENMPFKDKSFDLIYLSSVIEHTPNLDNTMKNMQRVSNEFYITMFKWHLKDGGLTPEYNKKKDYYSTSFNLEMLFDKLNEYSEIRNVFASIVGIDRPMRYSEFKKQYLDTHDQSKFRNPNVRLNIHGIFD